MIVAMLADQGGFNVEHNAEGDKTWFAVGRGFEHNLLLKVFHKGVFREGQLGSRTSDRFDETVKLGIDQLLMIRLAQELGEAPDKLRGKESGGDRISNQRPIAERAARHFSEDLRHFVRGYAGVIPRHTFVEMLEACMAIGLTTILTSIVELLFEWVDTGTIRQRSEQTPATILVDCSNGIDRRGTVDGRFHAANRATPSCSDGTSSVGLRRALRSDPQETQHSNSALCNRMDQFTWRPIT